MGRLWGDNPVLEHERRRASRGWGLHAGRALAVSAVLAILALLWDSVPEQLLVKLLPSLMRTSYWSVMFIALGLALFVAPASTAGAICGERRRGRLADWLVTDLSAGEVVVGKFIGGLATLATVLLAIVPVLLATASLGGVEPGEVAAGTVVVLSVAATGAALALLFSIWVRRPFEATVAASALTVVATYLADAWRYYLGEPPLVVRATDVRALLFDSSRSGFSSEWLLFVAGSIATTAALTALASWRLRPDGLRERGRVGPRTIRLRTESPVFSIVATFDRAIGRRLGRPEPTLDDAPVFWRACRRDDSAWMRVVWLAYAVVGIGAAAYNLDHWHAAIVNGYLVEAGTLLVGVMAATAWDDERSRGGFILLLTTPLSSRSIVRETWWGVFRVVPRLAILPTVVTLLRGLFHGQPLMAVPAAIGEGLLILGYGSVATGLGLWIGLLEPRTGRAVAWTAGSILAASEVWPWFWSQMMSIHIIGADRWIYLPLAWVSPWMGSYLTTAWAFFALRQPEILPYMAAIPAWIAALAAIGLSIRRSLERGFDRHTGRMPEGPADDPSPAIRPDVAAPRPGSSGLTFAARA